MGMSAWGLFITPILIAGDPALTEAQRDDQLTAYAENISSEQPLDTLDLFDELADLAGVAALDDTAMSSASGGMDTAIDIANLNVNLAENRGSVRDVSVVNSDSGDIANNVVSGNGGITTVLNNTGHGVVLNSIVNVNISLQGQNPN